MMLLQDQRDKLSKRIQNAGTEVVEAKQGAVSLFFFFYCSSHSDVVECLIYIHVYVQHVSQLFAPVRAYFFLYAIELVKNAWWWLCVG